MQPMKYIFDFYIGTSHCLKNRQWLVFLLWAEKGVKKRFVCIEYMLIKIKKLICPCLRLTAETKFDVPDGTSLGFKPPA